MALPTPTDIDVKDQFIIANMTEEQLIELEQSGLPENAIITTTEADTPSDEFVTTNTDQTITANKTFSDGLTLPNNKFIKSILTNGNDINLIGINNSNQIPIGQAGNGIVIQPNEISPFQADNGNVNLGNSGIKFKNLYLSGNLSDGTNNVSIENIVDIPSNQWITGVKQFLQEPITRQSSGYKGYRVHNIGYALGDEPTASMGLGRFITTDKNGNFISYLQTVVSTDGKTTTQLQNRTKSDSGTFSTATLSLISEKIGSYRMESNCSFMPASSDTYSLGSTTNKWKNLYVDNVYNYNSWALAGRDSSESGELYFEVARFTNSTTSTGLYYGGYALIQVHDVDTLQECILRVDTYRGTCYALPIIRIGIDDTLSQNANDSRFIDRFYCIASYNIGCMIANGSTIKSGSVINGTTFTSDTKLTANTIIRSDSTIKSGSIILKNSYIYANGIAITENTTLTADRVLKGASNASVTYQLYLKTKSSYERCQFRFLNESTGYRIGVLNSLPTFWTKFTTNTTTATGVSSLSTFTGYTDSITQHDYSFKSIYTRDINCWNPVVNYNSTPGSSQTNTIYFKGSNNIETSQINSTVGSGWNALNFGLRSKENAYVTIEYVKNANGWFFDPITDNTVNLGMSTTTRRWKNLYLSGNAYFATPPANSNAAVGATTKWVNDILPIKTLNSATNIWELDEGIYYVTKNVSVYYSQTDSISDSWGQSTLQVIKVNDTVNFIYTWGGNTLGQTSFYGTANSTTGKLYYVMSLTDSGLSVPTPSLNDTDTEKVVTIGWIKSLTTPNLTDTTAHTQTGNAIIVESYLSSDKKTWYRKWSDGWKECGLQTSKSTQGTVEITLPIAFSNTNYTSFLQIRADSTYINTGYPNGTNLAQFTGLIYSQENQKLYTQTFGNSYYIYCCGY